MSCCKYCGWSFVEMGAGSILFSSNELTLRDLVFSPPILPLILKLLSFFFFFNPSDMLDQDSSFGSPDLTKSGTEALDQDF